MAHGTSKKLDQYTGRLTAREAAAGMNAAIANARRLAEDATLLLQSGRFPTAASVAMLSLEESGKVSVLRGIFSCASQNALSAEWKRYRTHSAKNFLGLMPDFVRQGAKSLEDFHSLFTDATKADRGALDSVKQIGFYTDCLGKAHWSIPTEIISEQLATSLVRIAEIMIPKKAVTEQELQLWAEHMQPWPTSLSKMADRLATWAAAMVKVGLMTEQQANELIQFSATPRHRGQVQ